MKAEGVFTSKGQIVVPAELRKRHGIAPGTRVVFDEVEGGILLRLMTPEAVDRLRGIAAHPKLPHDIPRERDREIR